MNILLILSYLFFIGSTLGWVLELFYRRFFSGANPERKWINPGFCVGPYIPLYGCGLCILYLLSTAGGSDVSDWVLILLMAISMTAIEYIAGIFCLKLMHVRLWDYSKLPGNIQGLICPQFSLVWAAVGAVYYFFIHPRILEALNWLSNNLAFSFVIGFFFGVFVIDVIYSANVLAKIKKFAVDNNVVVRFEHFKSYVRSVQDKASQKARFLFPFRTEFSLPDLLRDAHDALEKKVKDIRKS